MEEEIERENETAETEAAADNPEETGAEPKIESADAMSEASENSLPDAEAGNESEADPENEEDGESFEEEVGGSLKKFRPEDRFHDAPTEAVRNAILERIKQKKVYRATLCSVVLVMVLLVGLSVVISVFYMPVVRVTGSGNEPTYKTGDILCLFSAKEYQPGDLCVISWENKLLIKRIIGLPGDVIDISEDGTVSRNGAVISEPYLINKALGECDVELPFTVPQGEIFIMGDNRQSSVDSRSTALGAVKTGDIVGKVLFRVFPFEKRQTD